MLLNIRRVADAREKQLRFCAFSIEHPGKQVIDQPPTSEGPWIYVVFDATASMTIGSKDTLIRCSGLLDYQVDQAGALTHQQLEFIQRYLPYCFLGYFADLEKRSITVAHFAQSLDGKIATLEGDSRWIGNEANLEHAHRMRALCDSILIGKNTLKNDHPQLTVRRVEGPNPVRIVVGSSISDCSSLLKASNDAIFIVHKEEVEYDNASIKQILYSGIEKYIPCDYILKQLYEHGIKSVLIEGGAKTTSHFLSQGTLDVLQLHLAPILMGSGRDSFQLPEIRRVDNAIGFRKFFYQKVANTYMFVGHLESLQQE